MTGKAWLPLFCGVATSALTWWAWGAWDPAPATHDESAYLLQAGIFAQGRWSDPPAPLPDFFEQMHVLSSPRRAAKYPPGHSLLLTPGVAAGLPAAVPVALAGAAGGLLVALARRAANTRVAILAWLFWLAPRHPLQFRTAYLSEGTTAFLWLAGWWALWQWVKTARTRWLCILSLCVGFGCVTRPLTTIAFAIPAAFVVLGRWKRLGFRQWVAAVLPGAALLLLVPLWAARTTGSAVDTPLVHYNREYLPFDRLGFGPVEETPRRVLPADLRGSYYAYFSGLKEAHAIRVLPSTLFLRLKGVFGDLWEGQRAWLFLFTLLGLFFLPRPARVALASAVLLVLLYLLYAHNPLWTLYYTECYPVPAFVTAVGMGVILERLARWPGRGWATAAFLTAALALSVASVATAERLRISNQRDSRPFDLFRRRIAEIPDPRAVVFVRYAPDHNPHESLIRNGPSLDTARVWLVYDLGAENARLCLAAAERVPYLYDEATRRLIPLPRDCGAPPSL